MHGLISVNLENLKKFSLVFAHGNGLPTPFNQYFSGTDLLHF